MNSKIFKSEKNVRLIHVITWFFLIFAAIEMVIIGIMAFYMYSQNKIEVRYMRRMEAGEQIINDLSNMNQLFQETGHSEFDRDYTDYYSACSSLEQAILKMRKLSNPEVTASYLNHMHNFNLYQQDMLRKSTASGDPSSFKTYKYISMGLSAHITQAVEMIQLDQRDGQHGYKKQLTDLRKQMAAGILVSVIVLICIALLYAYVLRVVNIKFRKLTEYCAQLARYNWTIPDIQNMRFREITIIAETVNDMKYQIVQYISKTQEQAKLETMLAQAQMSALRGQINPHFLFNALNVIGVTAMLGDPEKVMKIVEAAGQILRYSLYHEEQMTMLDEEIDIVEKYIFIQKCRFSDNFHAEIHNDVEGEDVEIPTMTIQPLVENCFKHGFGNQKKMIISVIITKENGNLCVMVNDDGIGFDKNKVNGSQRRGGIGLVNIRKRLEILYGKDASSMNIESRLGSGTHIRVKMPYRTKGKSGNENTDC